MSPSRHLHKGKVNHNDALKLRGKYIEGGEGVCVGRGEGGRGDRWVLLVSGVISGRQTGTKGSAYILGGGGGNLGRLKLVSDVSIFHSPP